MDSICEVVPFKNKQVASCVTSRELKWHFLRFEKKNSKKVSEHAIETPQVYDDVIASSEVLDVDDLDLNHMQEYTVL